MSDYYPFNLLILMRSAMCAALLLTITTCLPFCLFCTELTLARKTAKPLENLQFGSIRNKTVEVGLVPTSFGSVVP